MAFTFSQSSGRCWRGAFLDSEAFEAFGYAGHSDTPLPQPLSAYQRTPQQPNPPKISRDPNEGRNNPNMQAVEKVGPLPRGGYTIGPAYTHEHLGPITMNLIPDKTNQMFGRSDFRIHGDKASAPGTASEGCICLPASARTYIANSRDKRIEVLE